jgi:hypothetical protein
VLTGGLATLVWGLTQGAAAQQDGRSAQPAGALGEAAAQVPREDAVLVFGATGKLGRQIVAQVCRYSLFH